MKNQTQTEREAEGMELAIALSRLSDATLARVAERGKGEARQMARIIRQARVVTRPRPQKGERTMPSTYEHSDYSGSQEEACTHRDGDGAATEADVDYAVGAECERCHCTLGSDGYWYLDADQAPRQ